MGAGNIVLAVDLAAALLEFLCLVKACKQRCSPMRVTVSANPSSV